MRRDDYKDALNELQLSSKFCEEMEKKLAGIEQKTEDEYEDVVTHVDVIKPKRFRGLAIAAAFVICAGAIGGGAYYKYSERSGIEPHGEQRIYNERNCHFPFATLPLHDAVFNATDRVINATVVGYDDIAKKLCDYFESIEWKELEVEKDTVYKESYMYSYSGVSFSINNYKVVIKSDDNAYVTRRIIKDTSGKELEEEKDFIPEVIFNSYDYYTYSLPEGTYYELLSMLLAERTGGNADFCGIKASFAGAEYHTLRSGGNVSDIQAFSLSLVFNEPLWSECTEEPDEDPDEEPITLKLQNGREHYLISVYRDAFVYISKTTDGVDGEEISKYRCKDHPRIYDEVKAALSENDSYLWLEKCPIELEHEEAVIIRKEKGIEKAYCVASTWYTKLADILDTCDWTYYDDLFYMENLPDGSVQYSISDEKLAENENTFKIAIGDQVIIVNDNDLVTLQGGNRFSISNRDYEALKAYVDDIDGQSMRDFEISDWFIENMLVLGDQSCYNVYRNDPDDGIDVYSAGTLSLNKKELAEMSSNLRSFMWERQDVSEFDEKSDINFGDDLMYSDHISIDKNGNMEINLINSTYYFHTDDPRYTLFYNSIKSKSKES
ncbi:hypothetical protein [Ruminococcus sp.]|uniref:hypothetical protein n=2 Tax=Ruminococcus sp. TaxID=41978 RepID=UPI0025F0C315|nr:hypothetical protein [Ruminococcus sp.]